MSQVQTAPNLTALEENYEIVGELRMGERARMYMARRRDTGEDVVISVVRTPAGGENNALSHYAADTQLLTTLEHPQIPQVLEGRWIGKDEFAVVAVRRPGTTLSELLARGERFSPPRIAAILQEVSAILDWARSNGVVHRGVTVDSLAFEQGTNHALVSLVPTAIPMQGIPDSAADAQTIGLLAWALLTGEPRTNDRPLAELRPDLAKRVLEETERMVQAQSGGRTPDVQTFLGVLAAADALRAGELEIARMEAEILEARRAEVSAHEAEKEAFAARTRELEEQLADERAEFERRMADEEAELASVRSRFEALKAHEESQINAERAQLDRERQDFDARAAELERRHAELNEKFGEVARLRAEEGQRIDAAIAAAVETVAATAAADAQPSPELRVREPWVGETVRRYAVGPGEPLVTDTPPGRRPRWLIPSLAAAVILVLASIGVGYSQRMHAARDLVKVGNSTVVATPPETDVRRLPKGGFLTQSAGGSVDAQGAAQGAAQGGAPGGAQAGVPAVAADTAAIATTAPISGLSQPAPGSAAPTPGVPTPGVPTTNGATPTVPGSATPTPTPRPAPVVRRPASAADSASRAPVTAPRPRRDSLRDSAAPPPARPRSAFSAETDAIERADSIRRAALRRADSTQRRNGIRVRPDTLR